jgi:membrane protein involved in D-alanine export
VLLCGYDAFARWNKQAKFWKDGPFQRVADIVLTFHVIAFGLLIFSGRFNPPQVPRHEETAERSDSRHLVGWAWDATKPNEPLNVDVMVDDVYVGRVIANEPRDEMRAHGYGNGAHGFTFKLPEYIHDGKEHTIDARVVDGQQSRQLRGCPQVVIGELDAPAAPATPAPATPAPATQAPSIEPSGPPAPPTLSATPVPTATPAPAATPSAPPPPTTPAPSPAGQP